MKTLLILITIMLVGGCGKGNQTADESPKANPVKELTPEEQKALRDSVVGEYEIKKDGDTRKQVFLDNGVYEWYINGKKITEYKWSIVKEEIHVKYVPNGLIGIYRINPDKSITPIAFIDEDGKRTDIPKEHQSTFKKTK